MNVRHFVIIYDKKSEGEQLIVVHKVKQVLYAYAYS